MVCIYCSGKTEVTNSRSQKRTNGIWRRRQCKQCSAVFTTTEQPDLNASLRVSNVSGSSLSAFSHPLLFASIYECLKHTPHPAQSAYELTNTVINQLLHTKNAILQTKDIAAAAHEILQRFNQLAADQYAAYHLKP